MNIYLCPQAYAVHPDSTSMQPQFLSKFFAIFSDGKNQIDKRVDRHKIKMNFF